MAKTKRAAVPRNNGLKQWANALALSRQGPCPAGPIRVALGHPSAGWVQMAILCVTWQQSVVISCSDVYNPFGSLNWFIRQLLANELPVSITIEEEGPDTTLWAFASEQGDDLVEFYITDSDLMTVEQCRSKALLKCRTPRLDLASAFGMEVTQWLRTLYKVREFGGRYGTEDGPECDLRQLWFEDDIGHPEFDGTHAPKW